MGDAHNAAAIMIDDRGRLWNENSIELRKALFCVHYVGDLATDIIRNLGYIGVRQGKRAVRIRLHSRNFSEVALASLLYWLSGCVITTVEIVFIDDGRPPETCLGLKASISRLSTLNTQAKIDRQISSRHNGIDKVAPTSQLTGIIDYWRQNGGRCAPGEIRAIAEKTAHGRYIQIGRNSGGAFTAETFGRGLQLPEPKWAESTLGRPIGETGDQVYFKWVLSTYQATWESGRPDLAEIKAAVFWPTIGLVERHYERVLLPCISSDGTKYLFSANGSPPSHKGQFLQAC